MYKLLKSLIWNKKIVDPTELLITFYEEKGMTFTEDDKAIIRYYKPETVLRISRQIPKPRRQKSLF